MADTIYNLLDPVFLTRVKSFSLSAAKAVEGFLAGSHRSLSHGFGLEFKQYRAYSAGDDLRAVDWKLLGKTDRLYTRIYEEDAQTNCTLFVDCSASMGYQGQAALLSKIGYAAVLSACLCYLASRQGDAVGLSAADARISGAFACRRGHRHLESVLQFLSLIKAGQGPLDHSLLYETLSVVRKRSFVVVISDFLDSDERFSQLMKGLVARGCECLAFQILDREELDLPSIPLARFVDIEGGHAECIASPESIRETYRTRLQSSLDSVQNTALSAGVRWLRVITDEPLTDALSAFLVKRPFNRGR